jgi:hypothetical protein
VIEVEVDPLAGDLHALGQLGEQQGAIDGRLQRGDEQPVIATRERAAERSRCVATDAVGDEPLEMARGFELPEPFAAEPDVRHVTPPEFAPVGGASREGIAVRRGRSTRGSIAPTRVGFEVPCGARTQRRRATGTGRPPAEDGERWVSLAAGIASRPRSACRRA